MGQGRTGGSGRDEEQVERLGEHRVVGQVHECPVLDEGGVERGKGRRFVGDVATQVGLHQFGGLLEGRCQTGDLDAGGQRAERRQLRDVVAVDENQLSALQLREGKAFQVPGFQGARVVSGRGLEVDLEQRRQVGEAPLLVPGGGKPQCAKALDSGAPKLVDRSLRGAVEGFLERGERGEIAFLVIGFVLGLYHCADALLCRFRSPLPIRQSLRGSSRTLFPPARGPTPCRPT